MMRALRGSGWLLITGGSLFTLAALGCSRASAPAAGEAQTAQSIRTAGTVDQQSAVERGKYLVAAVGCNDCHTPKKLGPKGPEPDPSRLLSGHREDVKVTTPYRPAAGSQWTVATTDDFTAWSGPWGVSFTANLTPDSLTGLRSGVWTEEVFIKAMRTGKHMGTSRDILPPMPWEGFAQLTDEDLKAIWAYLGSIPPITNHVPDPISPPAAPRGTR